MTAEIEIDADSADDHSAAAVAKLKFQPTGNEVENEIFLFLAENGQISFKSQQIDDPEMSKDEKMIIACKLLNENHQTFLQRFGKYLTKEHINYFQNSIDSEEYDTQYILKDLQTNLEKHKRNVKNRRYVALRELINKNDYFSEIEMMKREPHLYEQFIGQYLTDTEKKLRDYDPSCDPSNTPFSKVLLDGIDKDRTEELRKKQAKYDEDIAIVDESTQQSTCISDDDEVNNEEMFPKIPLKYRKQWGNFEDEPSTTSADQASTSRNRNNLKAQDHQKYITASEREMLRQEFVEIMHSKFLDGQDKDFDYSNVDNNSELDDLEQINQDKEDEYFNDDNDEISENENCIRRNDSSEEDDLDIFMKHLNQHPTLKRSFN